MKLKVDSCSSPSAKLAGKTPPIENDFPFVEISSIAEVESWRKEIYRPIYHVHKWWAQRLDTVFRSIILSTSPSVSNVIGQFYDNPDLTGHVIYDPFMGSGTTIGETIKLGCTAIKRNRFTGLVYVL